MLTLKAINKAIKDKGFELVKAKDYFWFFSFNPNNALYITSVLVTRLNDLTLEQWVADLDDKIQETEKRR